VFLNNHLGRSQLTRYGSRRDAADGQGWAGVPTAAAATAVAFLASLSSTATLAGVLSLTAPMRWFCRPWYASSRDAAVSEECGATRTSGDGFGRGDEHTPAEEEEEWNCQSD
jgi:hypothetical protein